MVPETAPLRPQLLHRLLPSTSCHTVPHSIFLGWQPPPPPLRTLFAMGKIGRTYNTASKIGQTWLAPCPHFDQPFARHRLGVSCKRGYIRWKLMWSRRPGRYGIDYYALQRDGLLVHCIRWCGNQGGRKNGKVVVSLGFWPWFMLTLGGHLSSTMGSMYTVDPPWMSGLRALDTLTTLQGAHHTTGCSPHYRVFTTLQGAHHL